MDMILKSNLILLDLCVKLFKKIILIGVVLMYILFIFIINKHLEIILIHIYE